MSGKMRLVLTVVALGALAGLSGCTVGASAGSGGVRGWAWGRPGYHMMAIGGTGIQYIDGVDDDVFFHQGIWYGWYGGVWHSSHTYGGTWVRIAEPPAVFLGIPSSHVKYRAVQAHVERRAAVLGPQPGERPEPGRGPEASGKGPHDKDQDKEGDTSRAPSHCSGRCSSDRRARG